MFDYYKLHQHFLQNLTLFYRAYKNFTSVMLKTPQTTLRRLMSGILSGSTDRHFFTERRFAFEPAFHEPEGLVLALVFEHGK